MSLELATAAVAAVTPFILKGVSKISESIGNDLWSLVKSCFSSDKDKKVLDGYVQNPNSGINQGQVAYVLSDKLEKDNDFKSNVNKAIKYIDANVTNSKVTQYHSGTGDNIGRDKISHS